MQLGEDGPRLAITCVTRAQQHLNSNSGFNEQTSRWEDAPSANSLVWLSIIFTKDVAGARLGWGWPSQLTNDQSDFFPGHPSFNYCGERGWTRGIRYFSLLVRPTIPWAARESSIKPEKWIVRNTSWRLPLFNNELPKMSSDFTNWNANNAEWHRAQYIRPGRWLWWIRPILQSI